MGYKIAIEGGWDNYAEMKPLYEQHFAELRQSLKDRGIEIGDYAPQIAAYTDYFKTGGLLNYVVRHDGKPVGYANIYIYPCMHTGTMTALDDAVFVLPEHRKGLGRSMIKYVMDDLKARGCKRLTLSASTDLRAAALWARMGFSPEASLMSATL
jgi:GNAT superfamily N-acetyltransferase